MNLKIRKSQLNNKLETIQDRIYKEQVDSGEVLRLSLERSEILVRLKEVEFLLGDLTKDTGKV